MREWEPNLEALMLWDQGLIIRGLNSRGKGSVVGERLVECWG